MENEDNLKVNCLELPENWHMLRDGGIKWRDFLKAGLLGRGIKQSAIDLCLFAEVILIIVVCADDVLTASKSKYSMQNLIKLLQFGTSIDAGQK